MISLFGIMSIIVLFFSIASLVLHMKILILRGSADDSFTKVEDEVRKLIDFYYSVGIGHEDGWELCMLCEEADANHAKEVIKALTKIEHACARLKVSPDATERITAYKREITNLGDEYNKLITKYNSFINKPPGSLMAAVVGLKREKHVKIQQLQNP